MMATATRRNLFRVDLYATRATVDGMQPRRTRRKKQLQNQQRPGCKLSAMLQHVLATSEKGGICGNRIMTLRHTTSLSHSQHDSLDFSLNAKIHFHLQAAQREVTGRKRIAEMIAKFQQS